MTDEATGPVNFEVKIDGSKEIECPSGLDPIQLQQGGSVQLVRVEKYLDAPGSFEIRLNIMKQTELVAIDGDYEGKEVEVSMSFGDAPKPVYKGEISYVQPTFQPGGSGSYLSLQGFDRLHRLTRGTNARTWGDGHKETDAYSDTASTVIGDSGSQDTSKQSDSLSTDKVDSTSAKFKYVAQANVSDYHFLRSLGLDAGRPASASDHTDDKKISFQKVQTSGSPVLNVCRDKVEGDPGTLALSCRLRLSTVNQYAKVIVRGWDPSQKKAIVGECDSADQSFDGTPGWERTGKAMYGSASSGRVYQMVNHPVSSQDEADAVAKSVFERLGMDFVTGSVETTGHPTINPGDIIELKGFGTRFSGKYLVNGVIHEISRPGFRTTLQIARNAAPDPT